jgi:putative addiction module component (TIGR02574 family)
MIVRNIIVGSESKTYTWNDEGVVPMSTASEVLASALALPPSERASLVHSLIDSLPAGPRVFTSERELAEELNRRIEETKSSSAPTFDAAETMRRAREAVRQARP